MINELGRWRSERHDAEAGDRRSGRLLTEAEYLRQGFGLVDDQVNQLPKLSVISSHYLL